MAKMTAAKFWVSFVGAMVITLLQMGVVHGAALRWLTVVAALLGAAGVYLWPNKPVETDTNDSSTVTKP